MNKGNLKFKIILLLALVLLLSVFLITNFGAVKTASADWYTTSGTWKYRKLITIYASKVSNTDQLNFPMLVDVTDPDLKNNAQSDADDILFTAADGTTKLSHEIEVYNSSTGRLTAWVKIPVLSHTNNTVIYIYYGNATASSQEDVTNVWDSNYKAVWHLADGTTLSGNDSTGVHNCSITVATAAAGQIDGAGSFNGSSTNLNCGTNQTDFQFTSSQSFTLEAWAFDTNVNGAFHDIANNSRQSGNYYGLWVDNGNHFDFGTSGSVNVSGGPTVVASTWYHVAGVQVANTSRTLYVNGSQAATLASAGTLNGTSVFYIGYSGTGANEFWSGRIDEVRVSNINRSPDWLLTEYNNQVSTSTFYTYGSDLEGYFRASTTPAVKVRGKTTVRGGIQFR